MSKKKKGFTLIELIVVIAILAILAMLAVPQYNKLKEESAKEVAIANAHSVYVAALVLDTSSKEINDETIAAYFPGERNKNDIIMARKIAEKDGLIIADWQGWIGNQIYHATYDSNGETTVEEIDPKTDVSS